LYAALIGFICLSSLMGASSPLDCALTGVIADVLTLSRAPVM